jgi:2-amino-4-hydroxy-6-hydroxymethyldihydropteridine diphosphokinase
VTSGAPSRESVVVALGSNLGDREGHLRGALGGLRGIMEVTAASSVVETPPLGDRDQGPFLNMVVRGTTALEPEAFLDGLESLEELAGRIRSRPGGPRTLDLDLLFYGDRVIRSDRLTVPHPRWAGRRFVVEPLLEVAGDLRDPESGLPLAEAARPDEFTGWLRRWAPPPDLSHPAAISPLDRP